MSTLLCSQILVAFFFLQRNFLFASLWNIPWTVWDVNIRITLLQLICANWLLHNDLTKWGFCGLIYYLPISSGIKCGLCIIIASDAVSCFELINLSWLCWATVPRLTLYVRLCIISLFLGAMDLPIFTVDSFTEAPFQGNPAAVCIVQYASQTVRKK